MTKYVGIADQTRTRVITTEEIQISSQQAGEGIGRYDVLYLDGEFVKIAQGNAQATHPGMGMSFAASALSGERIDVLIKGVVSNGGWNFASNDVLFLSSLSGGLMTNTVPTASGSWIQRMGESRTPNSIYFQPEDNSIELQV
jgi:hypothetical protein